MLPRGSAIAEIKTLGECISHYRVEPYQHILIVFCGSCGGSNGLTAIVLEWDNHLFSAGVILIHGREPSGCARGDWRVTSGIGNRCRVWLLALEQTQDSSYTGLALLVAYVAGFWHCRITRVANDMNACLFSRFIV